MRVKRDSINQQGDEKASEIERSNTEIGERKKLNTSHVRLMKEEFTVRDLIYDKIKDFYQEELKGPSLKHLNEMKKLYEGINSKLLLLILIIT